MLSNFVTITNFFYILSTSSSSSHSTFNNRGDVISIYCIAHGIHHRVHIITCLGVNNIGFKYIDKYNN